MLNLLNLSCNIYWLVSINLFKGISFVIKHPLFFNYIFDSVIRAITSIFKLYSRVKFQGASNMAKVGPRCEFTSKYFSNLKSDFRLGREFHSVCGASTPALRVIVLVES